MAGVILYNNELKWKSTLKHRNIEFSSVSGISKLFVKNDSCKPSFSIIYIH